MYNLNQIINFDPKNFDNNSRIVRFVMKSKSTNRAYHISFLLLLSVLLVFAKQISGQPVRNGSDIRSRMHRASTIIIVAPHPDDEVLGFAGIIYDAIKMGKTVKVVLLTNGEGYGSACYFWMNGWPAEDTTHRGVGCSPSNLEEFGKVRVEESKRALKHLGLNKEHLISLGYPDGFIGDMLRYPDSVFKSVSGKNISSTGKKFTGKNLKEDLKTIFRTSSEEIVFTTHIRAQHDDHTSLAAFIQQARNELAVENILFPTYWGVIHQSGWDGNNSWPSPACIWEFRKGEAMISREGRYRPLEALFPPDDMTEFPEWYSIDEKLLYTQNGETPIMRKAVDEYRTQSGMITIKDSLPFKEYQGWIDRNGFLLSFIKMNHLFWEAPYPVITSIKEGPCRQVSSITTPGKEQDGLQAVGIEGNCSCKSEVNSWSGLRIGSGLESGRAWYDAGPFFQDSISISLRWKDNSWSPGEKTLEIYNWKSSSWEMIATWVENTGLENKLHITTALNPSRLGLLHQVRISVKSTKNARLHLESLRID